MKHNRGSTAVILGLALLGIAGFMLAPAALAQVNLGLTPEVSGAIGLATTDIRIIAARIIQAFFGLLGIIAVLLILYGGFLWMTSAGNEEQVEKAKKVLVSAVIGLAIMLSAAAIAQFVISRLTEATTGVAPGGPGGGPGGGVGAGLPSDAFYVRSFAPTGDVPIRNVAVRVILSRDVDGASVPGNLTVVGPGGAVDGAIRASGAVIEFTPSSPCPDPNSDRFCFDADTSYTVTLGSGVRSTAGQSLLCGGLAPNCGSQFRTGSLVDTAPPSLVEITSPDPGQSVPADSLVPVQVHAVDDAGIALVEVAADGAVAANIVPAGVVADFTGADDWDTAGLAEGGHSLSARALDVDTNEAVSASVPVVIRPLHCFNGVLDSDETAADCGGSCGSCGGGACRSDGDCASGACQAGVCVDVPRIDSVTPGDGAPGTLVTVSGNFFGPTGRVVFLGAEGEADDVEAQLCAGDAWSGSEITVAVPPAAASGPIRVVSGNGQSDRTDDGRGPNIADFAINSVSRPGICSLSPGRGIAGGGLALSGANLGDEQGSGGVVFTFAGRDTNAPNVAPEDWNPDSVRAVVPTVPVIVETPGTVRVRSNGLESNRKSFSLMPPEAGTLPRVDVVDPSAGPSGQYITLRGENFGGTAGTVLFDLPDGTSAVGSTEFPSACSLNFWKPDSVTVKVPAFYRDGTTPLEVQRHSVKVVRNDRVESNAVDFGVTSGEPGPGICLLEPDNGPEGARVALYGEFLGNLPGNVRFTEGVMAGPAGIAWSTTSVLGVRVPAGTASGPVAALRGGSEPSNRLPFAVGVCTDGSDCRAGLLCCGDGTCRADCAAATPAGAFHYRFSTGVIPVVPQVVEDSACRGITQSPSPYRFAVDGCANAIISARITADMDDGSLRSAITVMKCGSGAGAGFDPADCATEVAPSGAVTVSPWSEQGGTRAGDIFAFRPAGGLEPSTWYQVTVDGTAPDGARSAGGLLLDGDRDGEEGGDYVWIFKTRDRADACAVDHVEVTPADFLAAEKDKTVDYLANPTAANCNILECSVYPWQWESVYADGRSAMSQAEISYIAGRPLCEQRAAARAETPPSDPAQITATLVSEGQSDFGKLTVNFLDPEVVRFWPNCRAACPNAQAGADFNTAVNPATLAGAVTVYTCTNESCSAFREAQGIPGLSVTPSADADGAVRGFTVTATPGFSWRTDTYYRVVVRGGEAGVRSTSGAQLVGTNYGDAFSWTFKTKEEAARCDIASVDVLPPLVTVDVVGDVGLYRSGPRGEPDSCDPLGQRLSATDFSWNWGVSTMSPVTDPPTTVATLDFGGRPDLLPLKVIDPQTGRVVRDGPGCAASCLRTGTLPGVSVCGNGRVEAGEDCDDVNTTGNDGCSASCTHEGSSRGAACGDSRIDRGTPGRADGPNGEDCDFGGRCSVSGAACASNADCGAGGGFCAPNGGRACVGSGSQCAVDADCGAGGQCNVVGFAGCSDSCQNLGSPEGGSVCGNGDLGDGEDCDDGNTASGDGCSSICTNEGSLPGPLPVCGNGGPPEAGEDCDDGNTASGDGCSSFCLHEGTNACVGVGDQNCCGDGQVLAAHEDCDDGNAISGDGCSARCLLEGSSPRYGFSFASGSYCGDGVVGSGEECEYQGPTDGRIDPSAAARANFGGTAELACGTANLAGTEVSGKAGFELSCTCTADADCEALVPPGRRGSTGVGCGAGSCCYPRPDVDILSLTPADGSSDACRNALISARFTAAMDHASMTGNVLLAESSGGVPCPAGREIRGFPDLCVSEVVGATAESEVQIGGSAATRISFLPNAPLARKRTYTLVILGDPDTADGLTEGVRSASGVGMDGNFKWSFTTGGEICTLDLVKASWTGLPAVQKTYLFSTAQDDSADNAAGNALYDTIPDRDKVAYADAYTVRANGREEPIAPSSFYGWDWSWASSDGEADGDPAPIHLAYPSSPGNQATIQTVDGPQNGTVNITARARLTRNALGTACTLGAAPDVTAGECGPERICAEVDGTGYCAGESRSDSLTAEVFLCENPWPARGRDGSWEPYIDDSRDVDGDGIPDRGGTQFSFFYCRDAGQAGRSDDDLPMPSGVVPIARPQGSDILLDLLLPMSCASAGDGLCEEGDAVGVRVAMNASHLSALRWYSSQGFSGSPSPSEVDGYPGIADGRTTYVNAGNKSGDPLYTNVYLISYNEGATDALKGVYRQILDNWRMNNNLLPGNSGVCRASVCSGDSARACVADDGCGDGQTCSGSRSCSSDLDCAPVGSVCLAPKDKLRRDTVRLQDFKEIESALETYRTLHQHCSASTDRACFTDSNCPAGETCVGEYPGLEAGSFLRGLSNSKWPSWQATLGNELGAALPADPLNRLAACPDGADPETCWNVSSQRFVCPLGSHISQYRRAGRAYTLGADFEFKLCPNGQTVCSDNSDCGGGACAPLGWSAISPTGHVEGTETLDNVWELQGVCVGTEFAAGQVCGDGLVGPTEECDGTMSRLAECVAADGRSGFRRLNCTNLCHFQDEAVVACEAGRCGDGVIQAPEICDDGNLNGTYGRCNFECTALGDHCGDGRVKPGLERCDLGGFCSRAPATPCASDAGCDPVTQGQCLGATKYASAQINSCRYDCREFGPYCGDDQVSGDEQCDGAPQSEACVVPEGRRPEGRTRTCNQANCRWNDWGACSPTGACGDGRVQAEAGEQCDDGNRSDTDSCKNDCTTNVCGDGKIYLGREGCDDGRNNVRPDDAARLTALRVACPYGQTCNYCTNQCTLSTISAPVCGDGSLNLGFEICEPGTDRANWQKTCKVGGALCSVPADCPVQRNQSCTSPYTASSVCAVDCQSACPPSYEASGVSFRELVGGQRTNRYTDSVLLKDNEQKYDLHVPACRVKSPLIGTSYVTADIEIPVLTPVNVVFVVDLSQGMAGTKLTSAKTAIKTSIDRLFDQYYPGLGLMNIGVVSFSSSNDTVRLPRSWYPPSDDERWDDVSARIEQPLSDESRRETIKEAVNGLVDVNTDYMAMGIHKAADILGDLPDDETKIIVLLSDGESKCGDPDQIPDDEDQPNCYNGKLCSGSNAACANDAACPRGQRCVNKVTDITEKLATAEADLAKDPGGITIYTVALGTSASLRDRMKERSSNCHSDGQGYVWRDGAYQPLTTSCTRDGFYYTGEAGSLTTMYNAIVDSITKVKITIGRYNPAPGVPMHSTVNKNIVPGIQRPIYLPSGTTGFVCDPNAAQDLYFKVEYGVGTEVRISNVNFNICRP